MNAPDLFRHEVIESQARRLHGEVILRQSLPMRIVSIGIVVLVATAMAWVVFGQYAKVETTRGMLVPVDGFAKIYALRPGVVTSIRVKDSDVVKAGDTLAIVRVEMPNAAGQVGTQEELRSIGNQAGFATQQIGLAAERSRSEASRLDGLIAGLRQQAGSLNGQIAIQQQIVASMQQSFEQIEPVVKSGYISKTEYERRRQALLGAKEDLVRLRQQVDANTAEIAQNEKQRNQAILTGRNDQANARSALETLRQQQTKTTGEQSYAIVAPVAGRVTALQTGIGRTVEGAVPLMVLMPERTGVRADLFVPSRAIGFVKRGQEVRLLYDAFPYQRFGSYAAHIDTISRVAIAGEETGAPFEIKEPVYRVTVVLDQQEVRAYGDRIALQPGMTLMANIILDRQSFLDWMLDPLRSVSNRT